MPSTYTEYTDVRRLTPQELREQRVLLSLEAQAVREAAERAMRRGFGFDAMRLRAKAKARERSLAAITRRLTRLK